MRPLQLPPGERVSLAPEDEGVLAVHRIEDGERAGELRYSATSPGELVIDALVIDPAHRSYGLGSEAARLFVEAAAEGGYTTVRAIAPGDIGLSVYFWTRMGFRPVFGEGPKGGIWFERRLANTLGG